MNSLPMLSSFRRAVWALVGVPLVASANLVLFEQATDPLYLINQGTYNSTIGVLTRYQGADPAPNPIQGLVGNFAGITLEAVGDQVSATFSLGGGASNNSAQGTLFGFFNGGVVTGDAQVSTTTGWEGYFFAVGNRQGSNTADTNFGVYRQGAGSNPLFNFVTNSTAGNLSVDGAGGRITAGYRPQLPTRNDNLNVNANVTLTLTRISETQLQLVTTFTTDRADGSGSGTVGGIPWTSAGASGLATLTALYAVDAGPMTINGLAIGATSSNLRVNDLTITTNVIPEPAAVASLLAAAPLALVWYRRRLKRAA